MKTRLLIIISLLYLPLHTIHSENMTSTGIVGNSVDAAANTCSYIKPFCSMLLYQGGQQPDTNGIATSEEYVSGNGGIYRIRIGRLAVYLPSGAPADKPLTTVLVIPGGGYMHVSAVNEGTNTAAFLLKRGYAVAVLTYRLPNKHEYIPIEDAVRAMNILRDSAAVWNLDEKHIGVMGFSAGGHLAASLLTKASKGAALPLPSGDDVRRARPDFGVLVYPVVSMDGTITHQGSCNNLLGDNPTNDKRLEWSAERNVTSQMPPCFIVACQDDKSVPVENSIRLYQSLTAAGVRASMIIVPEGGHGWGFTRDFPQRNLVEKALTEFLKEQSNDD